MYWAAEAESPERIRLAQVLDDLHETTRALRRDRPVDVFVTEVQRTYAVYRQGAPDEDLEVLDDMIDRISRQERAKAEQSLKRKLLRRVATRPRVGPLETPVFESDEAKPSFVPSLSARSSIRTRSSLGGDEDIDDDDDLSPLPHPLVQTTVQPPTPELDEQGGGKGGGKRRAVKRERSSSRSLRKSSSREHTGIRVSTADIEYRKDRYSKRRSRSGNTVGGTSLNMSGTSLISSRSRESEASK